MHKRSLRSLFYFQRVEAFAVHAYDITLRDESVRIDVLHQTENVNRLVLLGQYHNHFDVFFAVPARTVEQGNSAVDASGNAFGYLFVFAAEDEELYRLAGAVDDIVDDDAHDEQYAEAEEHALPVVKDEVARRNDEDIEVHHHAAQGDILVFVDDPGNDIGAARTTVVAEHQSDAEAQQAGSDDASHEFLAGTHQLGQLAVIILQQGLEEPQQEGEGEDGIDGFDAEPGAQDFQGKAQEDSIDDEVGYLQLDAGGIVNDGGDTGHAAGGDFVRQQESGPSQGIANQSEGDEQVVVHLSAQLGFQEFVHKCGI